jgi:hypothetical protein
LLPAFAFPLALAFDLPAGFALTAATAAADSAALKSLVSPISTANRLSLLWSVFAGNSHPT